MSKAVAVMVGRISSWVSKAAAVMVARSERQRQCNLVFVECDLMVVEKSYWWIQKAIVSKLGGEAGYIHAWLISLNWRNTLLLSAS